MKDFSIIAITPEAIDPRETEAICLMLESGKIDRVHIRHKSADPEQLTRLLMAIPRQMRHLVSVHHATPMPVEYGFGVHLPSTAGLPDIRMANGIANNTVHGSVAPCVSVSCHSFDELVAKKDEVDYCFLSPIFDSISKPGYRPAFTPETLREAAAEGIIDSKVIALGGIKPERSGLLRDLGFGGAAMLGFLSDRSEGLTALRRNISLL